MYPLHLDMLVLRQLVSVAFCRKLFEALMEHGLTIFISRPPLRDEELVHLVDVGHGFVRLVGDHQSFTLTFDTNLQDRPIWWDDPKLASASSLGYIGLHSDLKVHTSAENYLFQDPDSRRGVAEPFRGFEHWSEVLCQLLQPHYAIGYHWDFVDEDAFASKALPTWIEEVEQGHVPDVTRWLTRYYVEYAAPHLVTDAVRDRWLDDPIRWTRRFTNGGLFSVLHPADYEREMKKWQRRNAAIHE
jgi:hypothetical protein